jgi:acyl-CoA synthetase (AMP-forming)/AMP-acid ligase II
MTFSIPAEHHPDGDFLDLNLPVGSAGAVLCYNKGSGLVPLRIVGAKKIFVRELEDIAAGDPEIAEFVVIPILDFNTIAKL